MDNGVVGKHDDRIMLTTMDSSTLDSAKRLLELHGFEVLTSESIWLASHELKTPLTSIKGFAQLMQNESVLNDKDKMSYYVSLLTKNADRLTTKVLRLVDSSFIDVRKLTLASSDINVYDMFKILKDDMEPKIRKKGIIPSFIIEERLPIINTDQKRILQVLYSMIGNAINYTEKGVISVSIYQKDNYIQFEIEDTGVGIPQEKQRDIFRPFFQADSSFTRKIGGLGVELYVCKGIVEMMGGQIGFVSKEGQGSMFYFSIPI